MKMAKKKAATPSKTATLARPVLQFRVHPDVYEALKSSAQRKQITISEEAARRIGRTISMDEQQISQDEMMRLGADQFLLSSGFVKVRDLDGHELWAKGKGAVEKYVAMNPELEAVIEKVIERTLKKLGKVG